AGGTASVPAPLEGPLTSWPTTYSLKLTSDGEQVTGWYSSDGESWTQLGTPIAAGQHLKIGLFAMGGTSGAAVIPARFEHFTLLHDGSTPPPPAEPDGVVEPVDWSDLSRSPLTGVDAVPAEDRKSTRLNSSHVSISYAVFCLKKKNGDRRRQRTATP